MKYDFDQVVERRGSGCLKWDTGDRDVLPMWVADMDFPAAKPILDALRRRVDHGIFGYSVPDESYLASLQDFFQRRHGWRPERQWYSHCPGIVPALHFFAKAYLRPGEKVLMHSPVYYPFFGSVKKNQAEVSASPLLIKNGRYEVDFEDFAVRAGDPQVKLFYLCNPHNPGGRVWREAELRRMAEICIANDVIIVSDEIHCDLVYPGYRHICLASLSPEIANRTITCIAPSKTFNLAGFQTSCLFIPNPAMKKVYDDFLDTLGIMRPNAMGITALTAAFRSGDEWLDQLMVYLSDNLAYLKEFLRDNLPEISVMEPEATYLVWLDFSKTGIDCRLFHQLLLEKGRIWLDEGYMFGETGQGFERINIACPRATLREGLNRMKSALAEYRKERN